MFVWWGGGGGGGGKFIPLTLPGKFRLVKGALSSSFNGHFLTGHRNLKKGMEGPHLIVP